jgi:hypothetical protein
MDATHLNKRLFAGNLLPAAKANIVFSSRQVGVWICITECASFPVSDDGCFITDQQKSLLSMG